MKLKILGSALLFVGITLFLIAASSQKLNIYLFACAVILFWGGIFTIAATLGRNLQVKFLLKNGFNPEETMVVYKNEFLEDVLASQLAHNSTYLRRKDIFYLQFSSDKLKICYVKLGPRIQRVSIDEIGKDEISNFEIIPKGKIKVAKFNLIENSGYKYTDKISGHPLYMQTSRNQFDKSSIDKLRQIANINSVPVIES